MSQSPSTNVRVLPNMIGSSLSAPTAVTTTEAAILTAPVSGRYKVTSIVLCERSGNARTVTVRKYASSLGASAANNLFTALALAANETVVINFPEGLWLTNGQILAALASANTSIAMDVNYEAER